MEGLQKVAPYDADMYWRHLHPSLQEACKSDYKAGQYLGAVVEAIKRYVNDVRRLSGLDIQDIKDLKDMPLLEKVFSNKHPKIDVVKPWGYMHLSDSSADNIRNGQKVLSTALLSGFRNPISHEEKLHLEKYNVFTYQDCLDALSILSHLRRRLDFLETDPQAYQA